MKKFIIIVLMLLPLLVVAKNKKREKIQIVQASIETMKDAGMIEGDLTLEIGRKAAKPRQIIELRPFIYNGNEESARLTPLLIYGRSARIHEVQKIRLSRYEPYYAVYPKAENHSICEYASETWYTGDATNLSFVIEKWLRINGKEKFRGYILVDANDAVYLTNLKGCRSEMKINH